MDAERYEWRRDRNNWSYEFFSSGLKGRIRKIIRFDHVGQLGENVYNLAFGDWNADKGRLDDLIITDNGDSSIVLHTVASAVMDFMECKPLAILLIEGSTRSRTRLYQMGISKYWEVIRFLFDVLGENGDVWENFRRGVNYKRFLVIGKIKQTYNVMKPPKEDEGQVREPELVYERGKRGYDDEPVFATEEEKWIWVFENTNIPAIIRERIKK